MPFFRVPVIYKELVIVRGGSKERFDVFGEYIDVEVKEVSSDDAPVATRYDVRDAYNGHHIRTKTRWFNGRHYRPLNEDATWLRSATMKGNSRSPLVLDAQARELARGGLRSIEDARVRQRKTFGRENSIRKVHDAANDTLLIRDGENVSVWVATHEPVYELEHDWVSRIRRLHVTEKPCGHLPAFRADRYEDAVEQCRAVSPEGVEICGPIEVLIPEAIQFDDEGFTLVGAAKKFLGRNYPSLHCDDIETIAAWVDLRDAIYNRKPTAHSDVARTFRQLVEILSKSPRVEDIEGAREALERWDMRPVSLDADLGITP